MCGLEEKEETKLASLGSSGFEGAKEIEALTLALRSHPRNEMGWISTNRREGIRANIPLDTTKWKDLVRFVRLFFSIPIIGEKESWVPKTPSRVTAESKRKNVGHPNTVVTTHGFVLEIAILGPGEPGPALLSKARPSKTAKGDLDLMSV